MKPGARHWGIAGAAAIGLHSALIFSAAWYPAQPGARATGSGGIEVSLGAAGAARGSVARPAPVSEVRAADSENRPETAVPPAGTETSAALAPELAAEFAPDMAQAEMAEVPPPPEVASEPAALPAIAALQAPPAVRPETVPVPRRKPTAPPERAREPVGIPGPPTEIAASPQVPAMAADSPAQVERQIHDADPMSAGAGGTVGNRTSRNAGSGMHASGGGRPGAPPEYIDRLRAWLDRHKEYPRPARVRREQGVAYLYFVIDRAGKVLDFRLSRSSGFGSLDRATIDMIRRADPLPGMPETLPLARLEIVVPVEFQLR